MIVHDQVKAVPKNEAWPAMDLQTVPEPLPVLFPESPIGNSNHQTREQAQGLERGLDLRSEPARRNPPPLPFPDNSKVEGGVQKERIGTREKRLGIVQFREHAEIPFEQFLTAKLQGDDVGSKFGPVSEVQPPFSCEPVVKGRLGNRAQHSSHREGDAAGLNEFDLAIENARSHRCRIP